MTPPLYKYYQLIGGEERWIAVKHDQNLESLKPTFETVLALDTLLESDPDAEQREKIKYFGPLYFDIDAEDIADSIESAQNLLEKLLSAGLTVHDVELYVSGKKGFHLIVPPEVFMEVPQPTVRLPTIYKEIAFKLAVPFLDFKVYTARRGRMLRTVYNQRDNGLYKAAITADQLREMTPESYKSVASQPTGKPVTRPCFSARFALVFTAACQRVAATKPKKSRPPTAETLQRDLQVVNRILRGESTQGFNKIALQLAVYAREVGWSEDQLVAAAKPLIDGHQSDGYRYNSVAKRTAELRRMMHYVDDNQGYSYSSTVLRNMLEMPSPVAPPAPPAPAAEADTNDTSTEAEPEQPRVEATHQAVQIASDGIYANDGESVRQLSDASLGNLSIARVLNGEVTNAQVDVFVRGHLVQSQASIPIEAFSGGAALHRELSRFGSGFWGSDQQARSVQACLHAAQPAQITGLSYAGLDFVRIPSSPHKVLRDGALVWAGAGGQTVAPSWVGELTTFTFMAEDAHQGVSDLMRAPAVAELFASDTEKQRLAAVWRALWTSNNEQTLGLLYGWMTACFYRPLIHEATQQFPLLHVAGAAGYGKTANIRLATSLHTYKVELPETTPNSTPYALSQLLGGYSATPILLDEYKPHRMTDAKLEGFRSLFRDLYNGKSSLRGGGGNTKSATWKSLGTTQMRAPLIFVAEALETETAILERSIPLTITKSRGRARTYESFMFVKNNRDVLSALGRGIVETLLTEATTEQVSANLAKLISEVGEELRAARPDDTQEEARARRNINERPLHNTCVVLFGLQKLWEAVGSVLGDGMAEFAELYGRTVAAIKDNLLEASSVATPEIIKFLMDLNEMQRANQTRYDSTPYAKLLSKDGHVVLAIEIRACFSDYRGWCRQRGMPLYYASPESATHAIRHFDGFDAALSTGELLVLEWAALQEAGMMSWYLKPATWKD